MINHTNKYLKTPFWPHKNTGIAREKTSAENRTAAGIPLVLEENLACNNRGGKVIKNGLSLFAHQLTSLLITLALACIIHVLCTVAFSYTAYS